MAMVKTNTYGQFRVTTWLLVETSAWRKPKHERGDTLSLWGDSANHYIFAVKIVIASGSVISNSLYIIIIYAIFKNILW